MKKYNTVISGGTFDHFHAGHAAFIRAQLTLSEHVLIGITTDAYVVAQKDDGIESFPIRKAAVVQFLEQEQARNRVEIVPIADGGIPPVWNKKGIEAIVVTQSTKQGAQLINTTRKSTGIDPLPIEIVADVLTDDGKLLSATRIRNGEVDRDGHLWVKPTWGEKTLVLPQALREEIQKPFDTVYINPETWLQQAKTPPAKVIAVGDVVSASLLHQSFYPKGMVVDLFVERARKYASLSQHSLVGDEEIFEIKNAKGTIQQGIFPFVKKTLEAQNRFVLCVSGEEDLLVLPYILTAPLGYVILYGQPRVGMVAVLVTEEKKRRAQKILETFEF